MSVYLQAIIKCDGCKTTYHSDIRGMQANIGPLKARELAKHVGWQTRLNRHVDANTPKTPNALLDYCPRCVDIGEQRETVEIMLP